MKKLAIIERIMAAFAMALILTGMLTVTANAKSNIKVTAPSGKVIEIAKNKKVKLKTVVKKLKDKSVTYKSANSSIAKVTKKGVVKGVKAGKTKIVVTSKANKKIKKTIKVVVYKNAVKNIKLNANKKTLIMGAKFNLTAKVSPNKNVSKKLKFTSSNKKVATVSEKGEVKTVGLGTATIEVKATDGSNKKATCVINVVKIGINKVSVRCKQALNVELTGPKKLEMEDFKLYSKYYSDTKYLLKEGIEDVHTEDNIHYEIILAYDLTYSKYYKVQIDKLPGVKTKEIIAKKSNIDESVYTEKKKNTENRYFVGKVGDSFSIDVTTDFDWTYVDFPVTIKASNLPDGVEFREYDYETLDFCISGEYRKQLNGHKSVITVTDTNGKKLYINIYFYVGGEDTAVAHGFDMTYVAYTPSKILAMQGDTYFEPNAIVSHLDRSKLETYSDCKNFKAEGLPDNVKITESGAFAVTNLKKKVKPGVYNIKVSGETPDGHAFSYKVKLTLVEGVVVSGKVTDQLGKPMVGNGITFVTGNYYNNDRYNKYVTIDENGNYSVKLRPGEYDIHSGYYQSYRREFRKNQKLNIKSSFYKMELVAPAGFLPEGCSVETARIELINSKTRLTNSIYGYAVKDGEYPIVYTAYVRKGSNYNLTEGQTYSWTIRIKVDYSSTSYIVERKSFKCTGQRLMVLDLKKVEK